MENQKEVFLILISVSSPLIIGGICGKISEVERNAGNFQWMRASEKPRIFLYLSKLILLVLGGVFSMIVAMGFFSILMRNLSFTNYLIEILLVFTGMLGVYIINLWVSIALGSGSSLVFGFLGSLLAGLF